MRRIAAETTDDLVSFNLDLSGLEVSAVRVDGRAAGFERSGSELTIVPAEPLPSATEFVTVVDYSGAPAPVAVDETSPVNGWTPSEGGIFVAGEPTGASGWFPVNDHPSDRASYTITVTAPDDLAVVSNGILVSRGDTDDDGTTTWRYEAAAARSASYLVTLAIDDLTFVEQGTVDGVLLRHAFASELTERARADTERLPEVLEYFNSAFGPFPFAVYGHLVVDTPFGAAHRNADADGLRLRHARGHRAGHQHRRARARPSVVRRQRRARRLGDLWLNEGFATYAEFLWFEHDGRFTRDQIGPLIVGGGFPLAPPGRPDPTNLFSPSIYFRGALTLHAIRLTVGDDAFFDILRGWTERFGGATATTEDFVELAEASKRSDASTAHRNLAVRRCHARATGDRADQRRSMAARARSTRSVMMPSTPRSSMRSRLSSSFTVQTLTAMPDAWARVHQPRRGQRPERQNRGVAPSLSPLDELERIECVEGDQPHRNRGVDGLDLVDRIGIERRDEHVRRRPVGRHQPCNRYR